MCVGGWAQGKVTRCGGSPKVCRRPHVELPNACQQSRQVVVVSLHKDAPRHFSRQEEGRKPRLTCREDGEVRHGFGKHFASPLASSRRWTRPAHRKAADDSVFSPSRCARAC